MLQQEVCFVHIRICVASGHAIPDINFKSRLIENEIPTSYNNSFTVKGVKPLSIQLEKLDESELRDTLLKLKGVRYDRDLVIETCKRRDFSEPSEIADSELNMSLKKQSELSPSKHSMSHNTKLIGAASVSSPSISKNKSGASNRPQTYAACVGASSPTKKQDYEKRKIEAANDEKNLDDQHVNNANDSPKSDDNQTEKSASSPKYQLSTIQFFSGNPAVDITNGIIQLYKTNYKVLVGEDVPPPSSNTLCMLSVPASIDTHNLLEFTAPYHEVIQQMRIIRDHTPNQFMVLLTFLEEQHASEFYLNLNNLPFSSLIPEEICRLAFVASVEALAPPGSNKVKDERLLPIENSTELPDCMVCLERMDESVQGLLTVLCNHSFHAACLQKWEDLCCPVCRYVQTPEPLCDNKCMVCGASEDLWICLVCGNVGCGRYTSEHAQRHYLDTHHNYAMCLSDNRVWDYAGDYFVHRLFQNKDDGKLVEKNGTAGEMDNKLEGLQLECMHLLTSQLESQRKYWEEQVLKVEESARSEKEKIIKDLEQIKEDTSQMQAKISQLEKDKQSLIHRNDKLGGKLRETLKDLAGEREMNKGLTQNQDSWKEKAKSLEERCSDQQNQLKDLQEQLRDVMFYIQASNKISSEDKELQEELREGQVVVGPSSAASVTGRSRGRGKRRR